MSRPDRSRFQVVVLLVTATGLAVLLACGGPSTADRIREVFDAHDADFETCYELERQERTDRGLTLESLARSDLASALEGHRAADDAARSHLQCLLDLKATIDEELADLDLSDSPEIEEVWAERRQRRIEEAEEERRLRAAEAERIEEAWRGAPDTVADARSGLTWTGRTARGSFTAPQAIEHCENLVLASRDDWRLPSLEELEALFAGRTEAPLEIQVRGCCLWSSTVRRPEEQFAYVLEIGGPGWFPAAFADEMSALCVR